MNRYITDLYLRRVSYYSMNGQQLPMPYNLLDSQKLCPNFSVDNSMFVLYNGSLYLECKTQVFKYNLDKLHYHLRNN